MQVDPTETTHPESFEELRIWMAIDTAKRPQPGRLAVNAVARADIIRGRVPASGTGLGAGRLVDRTAAL